MAGSCVKFLHFNCTSRGAAATISGLMCWC